MSDTNNKLLRAFESSDAVPNWFSKLVIGCMGACALGIGSWALYSVTQLESRTAVQESRQGATERRLEKMDEKLDRIIEQTKKP